MRCRAAPPCEGGVGSEQLSCGRLAVYLTPIGAVPTPQPGSDTGRPARGEEPIDGRLRHSGRVPSTRHHPLVRVRSTPPHVALGTPPGSRTPYPLIKSQVLWPDELEAHIRLVAMDLTSIQPNGTHAYSLTGAGMRAGRMAAPGGPPRQEG